MFSQISTIIRWFSVHIFTTIVFLSIGLISYGTLHRQSDAFRTMVDVSNSIREDLSAALNEIWLSIKNGLICLYNVIKVVNTIEIIVIGLFLTSVPDLIT